jgi:hypothetical protein
MATCTPVTCSCVGVPATKSLFSSTGDVPALVHLSKISAVGCNRLATGSRGHDSGMIRCSRLISRLKDWSAVFRPISGLHTGLPEHQMHSQAPSSISYHYWSARHLRPLREDWRQHARRAIAYAWSGALPHPTTEGKRLGIIPEMCPAIERDYHAAGAAPDKLGHARVARSEQPPSSRAHAADEADDLTDDASVGNHRYPARRMCGEDAVHGVHTTVAKLTVTLPSRPTEFLPLLTTVLPP